MAEKRFDIVVTDKVARSIKDELGGIGASAKSAHAQLRLLNNELGTQTAAAAARAQNAAVRTAAATARVNAEQARATIQTARATAENNKAALAAERVAQAEAKTALAKQRVATEAARTAEAQSRANIAYLNEEAALNKAVAAEARATQQKRALAAATDQAAAAQKRQIEITSAPTIAQVGGNYPFGQYGGSRSTASKQTAQMNGAGADDPLVNPQTARTAAANAAAIGKIGETSKLSAQYAAQLGFQLNDVFVSLASGQKPLTVFIQQGAQIAQLPAQAGMSWKQFGAAALNTLGIMKRTGDAALDAAAAQATAAAAAVASAASQAAANVAAAETEVALANAQREAAVTANQQTAASARLTAANEALAAANAEAAVTARALSGAQATAAEANTAANLASTRSLTGLGRAGLVGAVVLGTLAVATAALTREANKSESGLKTYSKEMGYTAKEVKKLNGVTVGFGDTAKAVFQVGLRRIAAAFGLNTKEIASLWDTALNWMARATRMVLAGIYASFVGMSEGVKIVLKNLGDGKDNDNPLANMVAGYKKAYNDAQGFFDDVVKQAKKNAKDRQDAMAADMVNPAGAKKGKQEWDRAKELRDANAELDAQIALLDKYGTELERAQQIEQIGRTFREHGVPLTATEIEQLSTKIRLLQEGRKVQEAMTAAEEAANGPLRDLNTKEEALNRLLDAGKISLEEYSRQMNLAKRAYEDATNPLAALNRELQRNGELMGLYGRDRDVAAYIQQLQQAAEAQGKSIYQQNPGGLDANGDIVVNGPSKQLTPEAQTMVDQYREQQKQGEMAQAFEAIDPRQQVDPTDPSYILDNHKEMYEELRRLREEDVISEAEAAERKKNLDRAYLDARLDYTGTILGNLSSLQQSKNRELAAIGKAAAIAQATIDGYRAVQAALVGPPGPPWSYAIAASTAVMTAANVAKIAGVGFQSGGHTGTGADNSVAGSVHRNEFVFDSAATRRIGVPALEAMRNGTLGQPGNDNAGGPRVVIKPQPGVYVEERRTSSGEIELIAERVARRVAPEAVADNIKGNPNSRVGKAMEQGYGVRRKR